MVCRKLYDTVCHVDGVWLAAWYGVSCRWYVVSCMAWYVVYMVCGKLYVMVCCVDGVW